jgi:hypothetical protein
LCRMSVCHATFQASLTEGKCPWPETRGHKAVIGRDELSRNSTTDYQIYQLLVGLDRGREA